MYDLPTIKGVLSKIASGESFKSFSGTSYKYQGITLKHFERSKEGLKAKAPKIVKAIIKTLSRYFEKVRDFYELPAAIKRSIKKKLTTEQQYKYINAVIESTHPGQMIFLGKYKKFMNNKNNIKLLIDGFEKEFKKLKQSN